jgi:hypothetical protein
VNFHFEQLLNTNNTLLFVYNNMSEFVVLSGEEQEIWEIDYENNIALNVSELNIRKENVVEYVGTIEDYLRKKGFTEVHFHQRGTLPSRAHYGHVQNCSFR